MAMDCPLLGNSLRFTKPAENRFSSRDGRFLPNPSLVTIDQDRGKISVTRLTSNILERERTTLLLLTLIAALGILYLAPKSCRFLTSVPATTSRSLGFMGDAFAGRGPHLRSRTTQSLKLLTLGPRQAPPKRKDALR